MNPPRRAAAAAPAVPTPPPTPEPGPDPAAPARGEGEGDGRAVFVERLTACQGRLFAYIYTLTADPEAAKDVLQETNRLLWKRAADYDPGREFLPWAFAHAFNQVRAARTRAQRERGRLVFQEADTLATLSEQFTRAEERPPADREVALERCLEKLTEDQRAALDRYYELGESMDEIARGLGRRSNTVAVMLHRVRLALAECIRSAMQAGTAGGAATGGTEV